MPEIAPEAASGRDNGAPESGRHNILSIHPPIRISEGQVAPAVLTLDVGEKVHLAVPLGAFTTVNDKPCFLFTVDLVGLVAASLGIGVGAIAVWRAPKIISANREAAARRKGH